jgi:hypothetical protein
MSKPPLRHRISGGRMSNEASTGLHPWSSAKADKYKHQITNTKLQINTNYQNSNIQKSWFEILVILTLSPLWNSKNSEDLVPEIVLQFLGGISCFVFRILVVIRH